MRDNLELTLDQIYEITRICRASEKIKAKQRAQFRAANKPAKHIHLIYDAIDHSDCAMNSRFV